MDPQRNLLTVILAAALGLLVVAGAGSWLFLGRPDVAAIPAAEIAEGEQIQVQSPETGLDEPAAYAEITQRPVFFADRQLPDLDEVTGEEDEALVEEQTDEPAPALEARVAGIIITPELRLAMILDPASNTTQVLREGMAMEGKMAAWRLDEIRPRSVRFLADDGNEAELELEVQTAGLSSPNRSSGGDRSAQRSGNGQSASPEVDEEARRRAEEVRRRVAERRAQLRAEAERRAREREQ